MLSQDEVKRKDFSLESDNSLCFLRSSAATGKKVRILLATHLRLATMDRIV
jgi:hypothetical protein